MNPIAKHSYLYRFFPKMYHIPFGYENSWVHFGTNSINTLKIHRVYPYGVKNSCKENIESSFNSQHNLAKTKIIQ